MQKSIDSDKRRKRFLFFVGSSSAVAGIIALFVYNYFSHGIRELVISIILISIIASTYVALIKLDSDMMIYRICSLLLCMSLFYSVPSGAGQGTSLYWLYIFPLIFFFYFGNKEGLIWFIVFSLSLFFVILLSPVFGWYSYGYAVVVRFIITYLIVAMIGYGLESSREFSNKLLEDKNQVLLQEITDRKRMEDIVRKSEEKFRKVFHSSPIMSAVTSIEGGRFLDVNEKFLQLLFLSREEVIGKTSAELGLFVDPLQREAVIKMVEKKGSAKDMEVRIAARNGKIIEGLFSAEPITINGEKCLLTVMIDVTKQKQIEGALRESEEKYRMLIENSHDVIYTLDKEGIFTFLSPSLTNVLGYQMEEVVGKPFKSFVHPDDINKCEAALRKAMDTGERQSGLEFRVRHSDGSWQWINSNAVTLKDKDGDFVFEGVAVNITERKQSEASLLESEIKFKSFLENAHVGGYLIQDGVFKYVNPRFAQIFGYTVDECLNALPFEKLIHADDVAYSQEQVRKRISGEAKVVHYNFRGLRKNGQMFHAELHGASSVYEGKPAASGTILDVTDRIHADKERDQLIGELQDALSKVRTLSGLLPICSCCKKIRDDKGYWNQVEEYVSEHTDARFTHGICPNCLREYYPEFADNIINNNPENTGKVK